jgi:hypothetical protein
MADVNDGQMLLLSALIACIFLAGMAVLMNSMDSACNSGAQDFLCEDTFNNAIWAQQNGMSDSVAKYCTGFSWGQREDAAHALSQRSLIVASALSGYMERHGSAYVFELNDTLSREYIISHGLKGVESYDGVIVTDNGGTAAIYGYGYDVMATDGHRTYKKSGFVQLADH